MTTAQVIFAVALGCVSAIIVFVGAYVVATTMWGDRWTRKPRVAPKKSEAGK